MAESLTDEPKSEKVEAVISLPPKDASDEVLEQWVRDEFAPYQGAFGQEPFTREYCDQHGREYPTGRTPIDQLPEQCLKGATEFLREKFVGVNAVNANRDIVTSGLQVDTTRSFNNRPDKVEIAKALIEFNEGSWWGITSPETLSEEIGWEN